MDRYVIKTVAGSYGACLLFLSLLVVLIDLLVQVGGYLETAEQNGVGIAELVKRLGTYYAVLVPFTFVSIAPFVTVIAGMFAVSRLMAANEVVPMIFSGRGTFRVLRPVIMTAVFSAIAMACCWEFVIPAVAGTMDRARSLLTRAETGDTVVKGLILNRSEAAQTLICGTYDHAATRMRQIVLFDDGAADRDSFVVKASEALWDGEREDWILTDGERHSVNRVSDVEFLGMDGVTPEKLWRLGKETKMSMELSYTDLLELRALRPNFSTYALAFHAHITFPLANLILLFLALPFAVHFERGSKIERVVFAILICGAYLIFDLTCQNLGKGGHVDPVFAAWLPTILFGSIGVVFFMGVRT